MISRLGYDFFDVFGLTFGFAMFLIVTLYAYSLLKKHDLTRRAILNLFLLCIVGHYVGTLCNYWFAITYGADSIFYFQNADTNQSGFGYFFAFYFLGHLKSYLVGESFLAAFMFFGALGLLGSIYFLLTYKILLDKISGPRKYYLTDQQQLVLPSFLLLCWPSYLFWTAGLVKDSMSFLSIGMFFYVLANGKILRNCFLLVLASLMAFFVRPYLFIILMLTNVVFICLAAKWNLIVKLFFLGIILLALAANNSTIGGYHQLLDFSGGLTQVGQFAIRQQQLLNTGSSIPIPTSNPQLMMLFLPYLFLANLFLPLGIFANNIIGVISSVENAYFLWWVVYFIKNRHIWSRLKNKYKIINFLYLYFIVGMSCFSLISTNLGLAMREKSMYVPPFLICIFLTFSYRRILILEQRFNREKASAELATLPGLLSKS